ncbi:MAG: hypothetical protein IPM80_09400 [Proteobacteria bacterium]|nr:hypothetical protein [Pseudomonadota bacterium]
MSLNVIELNDSGLRVTRDGVVVALSPGVALVDAHGVVCGEAALARAQVQPRDVYQHFWRQLNETPLPDARRHCRHHADLAWHHLASVLDAAGRPAEAVLVVPAHYADAELSLLLGIAESLKLKVAGLLDSSVAAVAGCAPPGRYVVVDMHRHHVSLCAVEAGEQVTRTGYQDIAQAGLARLEAAAVDLVAAALLGDARFDALHEADSAQRLHDQLPRWLAQAAQRNEIDIALEYHGKRFHTQVAARDFVHVTSMVLATVCERLGSDAEVLVGASLAALPGALDLLAPARALPADACFRAVAEHRLALGTGQDGVAYVTQLPLTRAPQFEHHAEAMPRSAPRRAPSHVLAGHTAHALSATPLYLHADGQVAAAAHGASCAISVQGEQAVLHVNGVETRINGVPAAGTSLLRAGDHITLAAGRALFVPIVVTR